MSSLRNVNVGDWLTVPVNRTVQVVRKNQVFVTCSDGSRWTLAKGRLFGFTRFRDGFAEPLVNSLAAHESRNQISRDSEIPLPRFLEHDERLSFSPHGQVDARLDFGYNTVEKV